MRVTRLDDGRAVKVRINDRGPHVTNRIIDPFAQVARDITENGIARVKIEQYAGEQMAGN